MTERERVPCPHCTAMIIDGARKCRACKRWLEPQKGGRSRFGRSLTLVGAAVLAVAAVLVSGRPSPVGEAPPLTPIATGSAVVEGDVGPGAVAHVNDTTAAEAPPALEERQDWHARTIKVDVHPLDIAFHPNGESIFVSADDASLREYAVATGKLLHMASIPAQGDRIRVLGGRYVAVLRLVDAAHIPVVDTQAWERDPILLVVGGNPADIVAMPDDKTVVTASSRGSVNTAGRLSWFDLATGRRRAALQLPHAIRQLYVMRAQGRPYVGAMGLLFRADRPAGAWMDLFDPEEQPFGSTRRSISVGRDPREGMVGSDGTSLFFVDHVSNTAALLEVDETTRTQTATVGQGPIAGFMLRDDRYGVTVDQGARTATVLELKSMKRVGTLMLGASPNFAAATPDKKTLFVALGGVNWPPSGSGATVISGDPPRIVATFDTGKGASRVATSADNKRAAIANYYSKTVTIIEK